MAAVNASSLTRVSISDADAQGNDDSSSPGISGSGRFVVFASRSALAPNDAGPLTDVYLRDLSTGTTTLVSAALNGAATDENSASGSVSDNGRYVAFTSAATNLVVGDVNGLSDVFVRDLHSGATFRISQADDGTGGNAGSGPPTITGDGRSVMFSSFSSNLVTGDRNGHSDVFVYDMLSGTNQLVSLASDGSQGNGSSYSGDITADGRFVAFASDASNLVAGDTNGQRDIFLRDILTGSTTRVSVGARGAQADEGTYSAAVSDDGRYVVFDTYAGNLVAGDTNDSSDVFLRDTVTGTTKLISVGAGGTVGNDSSFEADISADGRYVVFVSYAGNLVAGDTNGQSDIFLRDTVAGTTTRLSVAWNGAQANDSSGGAKISADGRYVTFSSQASNLVRGDTNGTYDIFRISLVASDAADRMIGSDGIDTINGLGGSDLLDGGLGADTLVGGTGNDTFVVDNRGDRCVEVAGGGLDTVLASVSYALVGEVENLTLNGDGHLRATGNGLANILTGNAGNNVLDGGLGADTLIGRAGDDTYYVNTIADRVIEAAGGGTDTVLSSVSYALGAGQAIEALRLLAATGSTALNLTGNEVAQSLVGNAGANVLDGRGGADTMSGGLGSDTYYVDTAGDRVIEATGGGTDTVLSSVSYTLGAGQAIEALRLLVSTGSAALDLTGNSLAQTLVGNTGANVLNGAWGSDVLTGRGGADTFVFANALGAGNIDRITDFAREDTIRLSDDIFTALAPGALDPSAFKNISTGAVDASDHILYRQTTGELFYDADGTGSAAAVKFAVLDNKVALSAADFVVV